MVSDRLVIPWKEMGAWYVTSTAVSLMLYYLALDQHAHVFPAI